MPEFNRNAVNALKIDFTVHDVTCSHISSSARTHCAYSPPTHHLSSTPGCFPRDKDALVARRKDGNNTLGFIQHDRIPTCISMLKFEFPGIGVDHTPALVVGNDCINGLRGESSLVGTLASVSGAAALRIRWIGSLIARPG